MLTYVGDVQQESVEEEKNNPPSLVLSRKNAKKPIDWMAKQQNWSKVAAVSNVKRGEPYEERQFIIRQKNKMGSSEEEAREEWGEYKKKADASNSDNCGRNGRFRLWLQLKQFKDTSETIAKTTEAIEQSMTTKDPKSVDRDAMRIYVAKSESEGGCE